MELPWNNERRSVALSSLKKLNLDSIELATLFLCLPHVNVNDQMQRSHCGTCFGVLQFVFIVAAFCVLGFFTQFKPAESFLTPYLVDTKNITLEQVSFLFSLLFVTQVALVNSISSLAEIPDLLSFGFVGKFHTWPSLMQLSFPNR